MIWFSWKSTLSFCWWLHPLKNNASTCERLAIAESISWTRWASSDTRNMMFNNGKSHTLTLYSRRISKQITTLHQSLEEVQSLERLGLSAITFLWEDHVKKTATKASHCLGNFHGANAFLSHTKLTTVYKQAGAPWGMALQSELVSWFSPSSAWGSQTRPFTSLFPMTVHLPSAASWWAL